LILNKRYKKLRESNAMKIKIGAFCFLTLQLCAMQQTQAPITQLQTLINKNLCKDMQVPLVNEIIGYLKQPEHTYIHKIEGAEKLTHVLPWQPLILSDTIKQAQALATTSEWLKEHLSKHTLTISHGSEKKSTKNYTLIGHIDTILTPRPDNASECLDKLFGPENNYIITGSADNTARIWDIKAETSLILYGHEAPVVITAISPNQTSVVTGDSNGVLIYWNFITKNIVVCHGHTTKITDIKFNAEGNSMRTQAEDGTGHSWKINDTETHTTLSGPSKNQTTQAFAQK
jgi:WD40 repeat protein